MYDKHNITNVEHHLDPKRPLVSMTDLNGIILNANASLAKFAQRG